MFIWRSKVYKIKVDLLIKGVYFLYNKGIGYLLVCNYWFILVSVRGRKSELDRKDWGVIGE